jgi:hypothetical protein
MSTPLVWAVHQKALKPSPRVVLINLTERANGLRVCWPSARCIAQDEGISERCVQTAIETLIDGGYISKVEDPDEKRALLEQSRHAAGLEDRGDTPFSNMYRINRPDDLKEWATQNLRNRRASRYAKSAQAAYAKSAVAPTQNLLTNPLSESRKLEGESTKATDVAFGSAATASDPPVATVTSLFAELEEPNDDPPPPPAIIRERKVRPRSPIQDALWGEGKELLRGLTGQLDHQARSQIGRLLKDAKGDCATVLQAIRDAQREGPAEPIPWIVAAIQARAPREMSQHERIRRAGNLPTFYGSLAPREERGWTPSALLMEPGQ